MAYSKVVEGLFVKFKIGRNKLNEVLIYIFVLLFQFFFHCLLATLLEGLPLIGFHPSSTSFLLVSLMMKQYIHLDMANGPCRVGLGMSPLWSNST